MKKVLSAMLAIVGSLGIGPAGAEPTAPNELSVARETLAGRLDALAVRSPGEDAGSEPEMRQADQIAQWNNWSDWNNWANG